MKYEFAMQDSTKDRKRKFLSDLKSVSGFNGAQMAKMGGIAVSTVNRFMSGRANYEMKETTINKIFDNVVQSLVSDLSPEERDNYEDLASLKNNEGVVTPKINRLLELHRLWARLEFDKRRATVPALVEPSVDELDVLTLFRELNETGKGDAIKYLKLLSSAQRDPL